MKKVIPFLFLPLVSVADFGATDSANLADIKSGLLADSGSGSFVSQGLTSFIFLNQRVSSWGGNFIKTVGDASHKFISEFGSAGWFTAVKAAIGVIQADVGRINSALTDVNTHLEIIEGDVSSIKDTVESIDTSVESIDSSTAYIKASVESIDTTTSNFDNNFTTYLGRFSEFTQLFTKTYRAPVSQYINYTVTPNPNAAGAIDRTPTFTRVIHSSTSYDNFFDALFHQLQQIISSEAYSNGIHANTLLKLHGVYITSLATTNLLQKILDTNDVWYAKIYDRIPTNLTVVVSNIATNASNDWHYTAPVALSSPPVLHDLSPSISRDVNQSFPLVPPQLTGDFKRDVIMLLGNMQQIASSSASVDMDVLTNIQVIAYSILSSAERLEQEKSALAQKNQQIADEGMAHENDLGSIESIFDLYSNNPGADYMRNDLSVLPSKLSALNVSSSPTSGTLTFPSFSFAGFDIHEQQINVDYSLFLPFVEGIRRVFGLFWFGTALFILIAFLRIGIQCLGRICSYVNPAPFLANVREATAAYI